MYPYLPSSPPALRQAAMLALGSSSPHWAQLLTAKDFLFNTASIFM